MHLLGSSTKSLPVLLRPWGRQKPPRTRCSHAASAWSSAGKNTSAILRTKIRCRRHSLSSHPSTPCRCTPAGCTLGSPPALKQDGAAEAVAWGGFAAAWKQAGPAMMAIRCRSLCCSAVPLLLLLPPQPLLLPQRLWLAPARWCFAWPHILLQLCAANVAAANCRRHCKGQWLPTDTSCWCTAAPYLLLLLPLPPLLPALLPVLAAAPLLLPPPRSQPALTPKDWHCFW